MRATDTATIAQLLVLVVVLLLLLVVLLVLLVPLLAACGSHRHASAVMTRATRAFQQSHSPVCWLSSGPEEKEIFNEILRVLKPGGRLLFMEHVAAPRGSELRRRQDRWGPLWRLLPLDGCRINCETDVLVKDMGGWASVSTEHFMDHSGPAVAAPTAMGCAVKAQ